MLAYQISPSLGNFAFVDVVGREACVYSLLIAIDEVEEASRSALSLVGLTAPSFVQ